MDEIREAFEKWLNHYIEWEGSMTDDDIFYIWRAYLAGYKSRDPEISRLEDSRFPMLERPKEHE